MSKHALPRGQLARRLARVTLSAVFGAVELYAAFVVGRSWLGIALSILAGWNLGLVMVGLLTLRDSALWGVSGVPR